jgi:transcriptional regulator with XRE-family HTH domain
VKKRAPLRKSLFSPSYDRFLEVLRQARVESGLTQTDAARLLGKPQSFIAKCEQGERRVDVVELLELCRIYGVSLSEFVDKIDTQKRRRKKPKMG